MKHFFNRLLDGLKDWIARTYFSFYCHFMQRPANDPDPAQCARFEERWPAIAWGVALAVFAWTAQLRGWWLILTVAVYLFAWWFLHHICNYERFHPGNDPYMLEWAKRRIAAKKL